MDTLSWHCDEHGTQNLCPDINGLAGHAWVQARRPYCDRGHWEWGSMGIPMDRKALPPPSHYFMVREHALAEVEEWLGRMQGRQSSTGVLAGQPQGKPFAHPDAVALSGRWERDGTKAMTCTAQHGGTSIALSLRQVQAQGGPAFVVDVARGLEVDAADCFPRAYMDLDRAIKETESFLAWRVLQHPCEIPGPLDEPARNVGPMLAPARVKRSPRP